MGCKRIFCSYCEKWIPKDVNGQKKHNGGVIHISKKEIYYFVHSQDPVPNFVAELKKRGLCSIWQNGFCRFRLNCHYSHLTDEDRKTLERRAFVRFKQVLPQDFNASQMEMNNHDFNHHYNPNNFFSNTYNYSNFNCQSYDNVNYSLNNQYSFNYPKS